MKTLLPEINSADKRFHAGNPATGEQGTRVTDTWLNDVQDRVRDMQAEAHYVLEKAGFTPKQEQQTQLYQAIVKIIDDNRKKASTTQKGEVQLYSGYDSDSEELAATPKVIKTLKGFIDSITRSLTNYIPNSKKSSEVNSTSADTVATSAAVKTAYDKGVAANNNAEGRISKSGDRLTGILYSVGISSKHFGYGAYANQYTSGAPFMVETTGSQDRDRYHPFVKGLVRSKGRYGAGFSFGYTTKQGQGDGFGRGIIHLIEDNGANRLWAFEHNGDFNSAGDVRSSNGKSLNNSVQTSDYRSQWGQTGWVKLPNGLILQWGKTPVIHDENSTDIVFPIAFPNKILNIQLTENQMRTVNNHATHLAALNVTNSKFTFKINSTLPIDSSADWFAIGY
jgi:probable tail fiber protein|nr:MAG TPA: tail fiber repeat protein [Caudoviricetes sp.]